MTCAATPGASRWPVRPRPGWARSRHSAAVCSRRFFVAGAAPLDDAACVRIADAIGLDRETFAAALDDPETTAALGATIAEALATGVFGVPSFVAGGRVYFGNDRLPILRHMLL